MVTKPGIFFLATIAMAATVLGAFTALIPSFCMFTISTGTVDLTILLVPLCACGWVIVIHLLAKYPTPNYMWAVLAPSLIWFVAFVILFRSHLSQSQRVAIEHAVALGVVSVFYLLYRGLLAVFWFGCNLGRKDRIETDIADD